MLTLPYTETPYTETLKLTFLSVSLKAFYLARRFSHKLAVYASPAHLLDNPVPKTVERISIWPHRKAVSQAPLCYRRTPVSVTCLHKLQPSLNPGSILPNPQPVIAPPKAGLLVKLDRSHMEEAERNN